MLAAHAIHAPAAFLRHKTTRRDHYGQFAADTPGIFDTLLWNERGEVTEFTRGNVILELASGERVTPVGFAKRRPRDPRIAAPQHERALAELAAHHRT